MPHATWYFDFVSPFSYLQHELLPTLDDRLEITRVPVLFAGLLGRWGQLGAAEIPPKRLYTYRFCAWFAERHGIAFRMPPAHPFNPLKALRLAVALDAAPAAVATIFRFMWREGRGVEDAADWAELARRLGVDDADALVADPAVKERLRRDTAEATDKNVFGVPTFLVDGELFWGVDATDLLRDYLADPGLFARGDMTRYPGLPVGAARRQ